MPIPFTKPALSIDQQIERLLSRGMAIPDRAAASSALQRIGYYRLSAYALPWRQEGSDQYQPGASLELVLALHDFDQRLRALLWCAMEPIEVAMRSRITLHLGLAYGPFAHRDPDRFLPARAGWDHAAWLQSVEQEAQRSHEEFVRAYRAKYHGFPALPLWMATEVMSFGSLSKLYGNLRIADQRAIARGLGLHERVLPNWLHTVSVIRNACAHHARCWDRHWGVKPTFPDHDARWDALRPPGVRDRTGALLFIIHRLLAAVGHPERSDWRQRLCTLVAPMARDARWRSRMGLPVDFETHPLWD